MAWFRRGKSQGPSSDVGNVQRTFRQYSSETEQEQLRDREALDAGKIPVKAAERVRRTVAKELPWMSTLDIHDLYLADEMKMTPLVQVAGTCYYHAATDMNGRLYLDSNYDAQNLVRAYYRAKNDAVDRMKQEALMADAHAIVDAQFQFHRPEPSTVECSVIGTAVQFQGVRAPKTPLISPLSGEEFYKLFARGWIPVNYCLGYHWHCMPVGYRTRQIGSAWNFANQELTSVTERFSDTRAYAIRQMVADARGGPRVDGFVGVQVKTTIEETELRIYAGYGSGYSGFGMMGNGVNIDGSFYPFGADGATEVPAYNLEFFATGAAVARIGPAALGREAVSAYLSLLD